MSVRMAQGRPLQTLDCPFPRPQYCFQVNAKKPMSKAEGDSKMGQEKKQAEGSKREEERHHVHPSAGTMNVTSLIQQGYRVNEGQDRRRTGLNKAVHKYGYAGVVEKIEALAAISKNHNENRRRLKDDLKYLRAQFKDE